MTTRRDAKKMYTVLEPQTFDTESLTRERFELDVLMGLSAERKFLSPKYFYDQEGSRLFAEITDQEEYYPTACEREILLAHREEIVDLAAGDDLLVVELGAGDGRKTRVLLEAFLGARKKLRYVPVDISEASVRDLTEALTAEDPRLECAGIVSEHFDALKWLNRHEAAARKLVLFLGSNIGNFDGPAARVFLRTLWNALSAGDLVLIGFDLKKEIDVMLAAYNDPAGATRRFNLNLLERLNRDLGAQFDVSKFRHHGTYDVFSGAMVSYLISLETQSVYIAALNKSFDFRPFEPIHVESSFKFLPEEINRLARETEFAPIATYRDSRRYFVDVVWRVLKS